MDYIYLVIFWPLNELYDQVGGVSFASHADGGSYLAVLPGDTLTLDVRIEQPTFFWSGDDRSATWAADGQFINLKFCYRDNLGG